MKDNMHHYYKRCLLDLFKKIQILREDPIENHKLCLQIQEAIIRKITYIERRIRTLKEHSKSCKKELRQKRSEASAKENSFKIKNIIKCNQIKIKQCQSLLSIFRDIGDALAFIYIDRWDIKPMSFKQAPGFISGKKGSRLERKCLRGAFEIGGVALLNDLTHCLRYGDITVPKDGFFLIFEMKSGRWRSLRDERQFSDLKTIYEYLTNDRTSKLYDGETEMVRISVHADVVCHTDRLNSLILRAINEGVAFEEVEKGLIYFVATKFNEGLLNQGIRLCKKRPILAHLNSIKYFQMGGYYPFTLSITDPESLYRFYDGELNIIIAVDPAVIEGYLDQNGCNVKFLEEDYHAMAISRKDPSAEDPEYMLISRHYFGRIPWEFLSLKWFLDGIVHKMYSTHSIENEIVNA
jgi:hypothetical protein